MVSEAIHIRGLWSVNPCSCDQRVTNVVFKRLYLMALARDFSDIIAARMLRPFLDLCYSDSERSPFFCEPPKLESRVLSNN